MQKVSKSIAAVTRQMKSLFAASDTGFDPYEPNPMEKPFSAILPARSARRYNG